MNFTAGMENFSLTTTNDSDKLCYPADYPEERKPFFFLYLVIIIIGIPSNSFSLYVSWQHIRQRNELGVYLFNLALSDLLFTIGLSLWVDLHWCGVWLRGEAVCVLSVILLFTNFYTSDGLLCCIALDRYLAVVHPLKYPVLRRLNTAVVISVAIWVLVISFNAATITWIDSYDLEGRRAVCFDMYPLRDRLVQVNATRFVLGFLFPVLLVSFCCRGICVAVRSNRATEEQERRRVSRLLGVVLLTLGLCYGPIHVIMLLRDLLEHCRSPSWLFLPYKISMAMSALNSLADPFLYCFITRLGKANVTQVVHFLQGRREGNGQEVV
ncbi:psychosine receptor-like [Salvelinus namaycush]|uniref:Psychosine receptor-like n=1 Tax=Salvelinus namaycush TaxID=8040 RepID=A0A8U1GV84_SALNM|nr:psychosine receptor-like [Salvelinus namaycush]